MGEGCRLTQEGASTPHRVYAGFGETETPVSALGLMSRPVESGLLWQLGWDVLPSANTTLMTGSPDAALSLRAVPLLRVLKQESNARKQSRPPQNLPSVLKMRGVSGFQITCRGGPAPHPTRHRHLELTPDSSRKGRATTPCPSASLPVAAAPGLALPSAQSPRSAPH